MKIRLICLILFLLTLCACQKNSNPILGLETDLLISMSSQPSKPSATSDLDNDTAGKPNLHSEYTKAIEAYEDFLAGKSYITLKDENDKTKVTIAPNHGGKYTIIDMNEDGVPELITNVIIRQYRDKDDNMYASTFTCGIYSYQGGEIVNWYEAGDDSFEVLSNKALLYEFDGLGAYNYIYIELDYDGKYSYYMHAYKTAGIEDEDWKYYVSYDSKRDSAIEIATENEWLDLLEPYLSLRTDIIPWNDYTFD